MQVSATGKQCALGASVTRLRIELTHSSMAKTLAASVRADGALAPAPPLPEVDRQKGYEWAPTLVCLRHYCVR
jgi:hypothetical protein